MKRFSKLILAALLLISVCACSDLDPIDEKIYEASNLIGDEDYERARMICDNLYKNSYSKMNLERKCDLAVMYCLIYADIDDEADLAKFMQIFRDLKKTSPQAARKYIKNTYGDEVYDGLQMYKTLGEMDEDDWDAGW